MSDCITLHHLYYITSPLFHYITSPILHFITYIYYITLHHLYYITFYITSPIYSLYTFHFVQRHCCCHHYRRYSRHRRCRLSHQHSFVLLLSSSSSLSSSWPPSYCAFADLDLWYEVPIWQINKYRPPPSDWTLNQSRCPDEELSRIKNNNITNDAHGWSGKPLLQRTRYSAISDMARLRIVLEIHFLYI